MRQDTAPLSGRTARTVILASLGGGLEVYDFAVYGIFAADIAPAFFPAGNEAVSQISTFAVFAGGYLIRPLGGIVFSHFGDRFGRRTVFLATLLGVSLAALAMALCPSHNAWGPWGTATFAALRLLQGFCLGGELPGAVTYLAEIVRPGRAGLARGILFGCASLGVVVASGVNAGLHVALPPPAVAEYGWRIAFGVGGVLGFVSYLPRRLLVESPVFAAIRERQQVERVPLLHVLRNDFERVVVGIGITATIAGFNGTLFAYLPAYLVRVAGYPAGDVATAVTIGLASSLPVIVAAGALSDTLSARTVFGIGAAALLLGSWPFYQAVSGHGTLHLAWWLAGLGITNGIIGGSFAGLLTELFQARVRFSGIALAYNASAALFSGPAPAAAVGLIAATGNTAAPALYLMVVATVGLAACLWTARMLRTPGT